jgi:hypothetical protein
MQEKGISDVWEAKENKTTYHLNQEHPLFGQLKQELSNHIE